MEPNYETVVNPMDLIWTMAVYALHGLIAVLHAGLAAYLLVTGVRRAMRRDARVFGALRIALGLALLAPIALGAPVLVSLLAAVGAGGVILAERQPAAGRFVRNGALAFAAFTAAFMAWETEDNLTLTSELVFGTSEFRNEEIEWQLAKDPKSPKVGDLAPDFELQDPEGKVQVRLSDFRGKRPVALVFGSYT